MKSYYVVFSFLILTALPQVVKADTTDVKQCLQDIQTHWMPKNSAQFTGQNRLETPCQLNLNFNNDSFQVSAASAPQSIDFQLKDSDAQGTRKLEKCRVDNEKIYFVFEEKTGTDLEKREQIQMTLLKRNGKNLTLILLKRENKLFRLLQQTSLICHLN